MANGITRYYPHPEVVQLIFGQLLSENQNKPRSRHQNTEGFSWKWEGVQGLAPVGLHSMTAGIAM